MQTLPRFWKALDELPAAATDTFDWRQRLGSEFDSARRFLYGTGAVAGSIDCPSPGGDGCPRSVVKLPSGGLRAVCRSSAGRCDPVDLRRDDVAILALDRAVLAAGLGQALEISSVELKVRAQPVVSLGRHAVAAGLSAPVLLALPGPRDPPTEEEFRLAGLGADCAIVLTPRGSSLSTATLAKLLTAGHLVLGLADVTALDSRGVLTAVQPANVLFGLIRQALLGRTGAVPSAPRVLLPPETEWGQVLLTLSSSETIICNVAGNARQMDPADLGMRSAKNAKPTNAWVLLVALLAANGVLRVEAPSLAAKVRKQKQTLSDHLRMTFGIAGDPMPWSKAQNAYVARFVARDERPKAEREARRPR